MKIGILGSGAVAQALGTGLLRHGHEVMLGTRSPAKLADWGKANPKGKIASFAEAARFAELAILAGKGSAAAEILRAAGAKSLAGKTVVDATNPLDEDAPPTNGVIRLFTQADESLMERQQREFDALRFVKAFNQVGASLMVDPRLEGGRPTMFICGNDDGAKRAVSRLLDEIGWDSADMGRVEAARAIEPLCILWCIPGFLRGDWNHAFKLLPAKGAGGAGD